MGIRDIVVDNGRVIDRIVYDRRIMNNGGVIDNGYILLFVDIIVVDMRTGDVLLRNKGPVMRWRVIAAAGGYADAYAGSQRRPAIILGTLPPADPGRRPFVTGDPHPAISFFKKPAAVVEGGPAPGVIGSPGPAAVGIHPISVAGIGFEIRTDIRHPYIAVLRIIDPLTIGTQGIVKRLIRGFGSRRRRRWRGRAFDDDMGRSAGVQGEGCKGDQCINQFTHTTIFRWFFNK